MVEHCGLDGNANNDMARAAERDAYASLLDLDNVFMMLITVVWLLSSGFAVKGVRN